MNHDDSGHGIDDDLGNDLQTEDADSNDDGSIYEKLYPACGDSESMVNVQCRLEARDLWLKFHELGTEMIITKSGR